MEPDKTIENVTAEEMVKDAQASNPAPSEEATGDKTASTPEWKGDEYGFDWNGKRIVPDTRDKLMTWVSQGYNYSQRAGELNRLKSEWENKVKTAETRAKELERYREIDEYARTNPDWWKHVESGYQGRQTFQLDPNLQPVVAPILQRLEQTEGVLQQWQRAQEQEQISKADQALDSEIESTRKAYPTIDLASVDESGKSLELRVLQHAQEIGTTSFRAAFRDYLHDKLVEHAKADGRSAIAKDAQTARARGIIGQSPTPQKAVPEATNVRGKSYSQLAQEAMAAYGINQ